jgi:ankyrin repeat protein
MPGGDSAPVGGSWSSTDSALFVAAASGDERRVERLLDFQAEEHPEDDLTSARDEVGRTLFYTACMHGSVEVAQLLAERGLTCASQPNRLGVTPVCAAAWQGHLAAVRYLCEGASRGELDVSIETADRFGVRPLFAACRQGHEDVVRYLVEEQSADLACRTSEGQTCFFTACDMGQLATARYLAALSPAVDTACVTDRGWSPLIAAACRGHGDIIEFLLDEERLRPMGIAAANPADTTQDGETAFFGAAFHGQVAAARRLAASAPDTAFRPNLDGQTPLFAAARRGHTEVVRFILGQYCRSYPSASERAALLSATFSGSGLSAEEAAEQAGHTELADLLAGECARLRLVARAVSGALLWDLVEELTVTNLRRDPSSPGGDAAAAPAADPAAVDGVMTDWVFVERRLRAPVPTGRGNGRSDHLMFRPFIPAGRRLRCAQQLLALATAARGVDAADKRHAPPSPSPLRMLCEDLQQLVAGHVLNSPRLWL